MNDSRPATLTGARGVGSVFFENLVDIRGLEHSLRPSVDLRLVRRLHPSRVALCHGPKAQVEQLTQQRRLTRATALFAPFFAPFLSPSFETLGTALGS